MWARPSYRIPLLVALLVGVIGFAWAISTLSSSTTFRQQLLATRSQYVAASQDIHKGVILTGAELKLSYVTTTDDFTSIYFPGASLGSLTGKVAEVDIHAGELLPRDGIVSAGTANFRKVPVTFAYAPELHAGDVVDILVYGDETNSKAIQPFLSQVTLFSSGVNSWQINVPASQVSAVVYATANLKLIAVVDVPGSSRASLGSVGSYQEAAKAVGGQ